MQSSRGVITALMTQLMINILCNTSNQAPHVIRLLMCAFVLGLPEHKVRVIAPDVGGGFGSKMFHYTEEALLTWCTKKIGRLC